jgi:two-component system KDP operon response regulator KdpE
VDEPILVLLVEDETAMRRFVRASLSSHGFRLIEATTAREAQSLLPGHRPRLILLDLGLPDGDGIDLTRRIREWSQVPLIVLSARGREEDKVAALDAGADDYMVKPFGVEELLARVRTALRHRLQQQGLGPVFRLRELAVDFLARRVMIGTSEVKLSRREFDLLRLLAEHAGKVMTHRQILTAVWGEAHGQDVEYLRVYVRQLRAKLGDDPANPRFIETEPAVGYRLKSEYGPSPYPGEDN